MVLANQNAKLTGPDQGHRISTGFLVSRLVLINLVPRACDPWEGNEGSGIIRCRKPGILAKIELRIHFDGQSDSSLKWIIPEPSFPSQGSQARGTRLRPHMKALGTRLLSAYTEETEYWTGRIR
jgi:hypothetical protein